MPLTLIDATLTTPINPTETITIIESYMDQDRESKLAIARARLKKFQKRKEAEVGNKLEEKGTGLIEEVIANHGENDIFEKKTGLVEVIAKHDGDLSSDIVENSIDEKNPIVEEQQINIIPSPLTNSPPNKNDISHTNQDSENIAHMSQNISHNNQNSENISSVNQISENIALIHEDAENITLIHQDSENITLNQNITHHQHSELIIANLLAEKVRLEQELLLRDQATEETRQLQESLQTAILELQQEIVALRQSQQKETSSQQSLIYQLTEALRAASQDNALLVEELTALRQEHEHTLTSIAESKIITTETHSQTESSIYSHPPPLSQISIQEPDSNTNSSDPLTAQQVEQLKRQLNREQVRTARLVAHLREVELEMESWSQEVEKLDQFCQTDEENVTVNIVDEEREKEEIVETVVNENLSKNHTESAVKTEELTLLENEPEFNPNVEKEPERVEPESEYNAEPQLELLTESKAEQILESEPISESITSELVNDIKSELVNEIKSEFANEIKIKSESVNEMDFTWQQAFHHWQKESRQFRQQLLKLQEERDSWRQACQDAWLGTFTKEPINPINPVSSPLESASQRFIESLPVTKQQDEIVCLQCVGCQGELIYL